MPLEKSAVHSQLSPPPQIPTPEVRVRMSPDAPGLLRDMADVLQREPHLRGPELAATLEPRLNQLVASVAPSLPPIRRKLFAMRRWLHVLRHPGAARHHGGLAHVRSFLLADCAVLDCLLAGPPDPDPDEGLGGTRTPPHRS